MYNKTDDHAKKTSKLKIVHKVFIAKDRTADYQTTTGLLRILKNDANEDDVAAFLEDRNLPLEEVGRHALARRIIAAPPTEGYLTISNALQWRLQYARAIEKAGRVRGVSKL